MDTVYAFEYNFCVYESGFAAQSLHRTESGAQKAMEEFLQQKYKLYKDQCVESRHPITPYKEWLAEKNRFEAWQVEPMNINE